MITHLDLFSGIGGFAYALQSKAKTTLYCEMGQFQRDVLMNAMKKKYISEGSIYQDIDCIPQGLDIPDVITAGWPCQNISLLGDRKGLAGEKSSVFWKLLKVISYYKPRVVVLENVAAIRTNGLNQVLESIHELGYTLAWGIFSAEEVGAPHMRRRWYCVGALNSNESSMNIICALKKLTLTKHDWKTEPTSRSDKAPRVNHRMRCMSLGNSIVPQCAQFAIGLLCSTLLSDERGTAVAMLEDIPQHGMLVDKKIFALPYRREQREVKDKKLTFIPCQQGHHTKDCILQPFYKSLWPTPCASRSSWVPAKRLNKRRTTELCTAVAHEIHTERPFSYISPDWVEWLMGYPEGYTFLSQQP